MQELEENQVFEFQANEVSPKAKKIKTSKKLGVLEKIENLGSFNAFVEEPKTPESRNKWGFREQPKTPPAPPGFKIKSLVPRDIAGKKTKKNMKKIGAKKNIPERKNYLAKPVFTTSGEFLEEPFVFDTNCIGLSKNSQISIASLNVDKKSKKIEQNSNPALKFKESAYSRKGIVRDNSKKSLGKKN